MSIPIKAHAVDLLSLPPRTIFLHTYEGKASARDIRGWSLHSKEKIVDLLRGHLVHHTDSHERKKYDSKR